MADCCKLSVLFCSYLDKITMNAFCDFHDCAKGERRSYQIEQSKRQSKSKNNHDAHRKLLFKVLR